METRQHLATLSTGHCCGQLARSADSIGANIAEAFGRYHYGEKLHHLYIARGSLYETKYWLNRCESRKLVTPEAARQYANKLTDLAQSMNSFARSLRNQQRTRPAENNGQAVRETSPIYVADPAEQDPLFSEADLAILRETISNL